jgi:hypothetical protein
MRIVLKLFYGLTPIDKARPLSIPKPDQGGSYESDLLRDPW